MALALAFGLGQSGVAVEFGGLSLLEWLAVAEHELLLFAGIFILIGGLDELAIDFAWLWLRLTGRAPSRTVHREEIGEAELLAPTAVFIPTWAEERVIGETVAHALRAWPHDGLRFYVGCYANDPATLLAAGLASSGDDRLRLVILDRDGPTTKADCLNGLYARMEADEARQRFDFGLIVLHDAEDMVDPAALGALDLAIEHADFVQLPVMPEPQRSWVGSHYCEEFAEAHGKAMVVRQALGAALPAAGVGCGFSRRALRTMASLSANGRPFSDDALTEDYEIGLRIKAAGLSSLFLRLRGYDDRLVATRACFPDRLDAAVRQKTRWIHGIALQGWDRIGWSRRPAELWMLLRDRRGPLTALVLASAYLLLVISGVLTAAAALGYERPWVGGPLVELLLVANMATFVWRALMRFAFTAREHGRAEGLRAVLRIPLANVIAIMAGRRALFAYLRALAGHAAHWDKTDHHAHPASRSTAEQVA